MQMRVIIKKAKKEKPAAADHRNFYAKTFITNIAAEADNDKGARKLAQACAVRIKTIHANLHRI
jgi:hypothetical protein